MKGSYEEPDVKPFKILPALLPDIYCGMSLGDEQILQPLSSTILIKS